MITVSAVPAFSDNYLWLIEHDGRAAVVDPGDGHAVLTALDARGLTLVAILVTHHHPDHIGGIPALLEKFPVPVYGPRAELAKIKTITEPLDDGAIVDLTTLGLPLRFDILAVPGHTLGHIAYHAAAEKLLFCGDTLFVSGCGRLFEGTPAQMHASLSRLAALPGETAVYCAHEYTLSNLDFATSVVPNDPAFAAEYARVAKLRAEGGSTVPSTIARERALNPFLLSSDARMTDAARHHEKAELADSVAVFAALRRWKDGHRQRQP
jgi:hydroxyacylglutathione hydrolase